MIPIVIYQKDTAIPSGNCYIVAQNGVYLKKDTGLVFGIVKVEKLSFLQELKAEVKVKIPPIPLEIFVPIRRFFAEVYTLYKSESIVLLYFDEKKNEYFVLAPEQVVSGASLKYQSTFRENGFKLVGSIHSHADFSAFHSSTDHHDEADFDGLHITIGNVNQIDFSVSMEIVVNNNRFPQEPNDWVKELVEKKREMLKERKAKPTSYNLLDDAPIENKFSGNFDFEKNLSRFDSGLRFFHFNDQEKKYNFIFPEGKKYEEYAFPPEWLAAVKWFKPLVLARNYWTSNGVELEYLKQEKTKK